MVVRRDEERIASTDHLHRLDPHLDAGDTHLYGACHPRDTSMLRSHMPAIGLRRVDAIQLTLREYRHDRRDLQPDVSSRFHQLRL